MKAIIRFVKKPTVRRFAVVGATSPAIDFTILFILQHLGLPVIAANIISTTTAFCFSFYANKRFTFKTSGTNIKREMLLFVIVTLTGMWGLQSLVIVFSLPIFKLFASHELALLGAKLFATVFSTIWNYLFYKHVVFRHSPTPAEQGGK